MVSKSCSVYQRKSHDDKRIGKQKPERHHQGTRRKMPLLRTNVQLCR